MQHAISSLCHRPRSTARGPLHPGDRPPDRRPVRSAGRRHPGFRRPTRSGGRRLARIDRSARSARRRQADFRRPGRLETDRRGPIDHRDRRRAVPSIGERPTDPPSAAATPAVDAARRRATGRHTTRTPSPTAPHPVAHRAAGRATPPSVCPTGGRPTPTRRVAQAAGASPTRAGSLRRASGGRRSDPAIDRVGPDHVDPAIGARRRAADRVTLRNPPCRRPPDRVPRRKSGCRPPADRARSPIGAGAAARRAAAERRPADALGAAALRMHTPPVARRRRAAFEAISPQRHRLDPAFERAPGQWHRAEPAGSIQRELVVDPQPSWIRVATPRPPRVSSLIIDRVPGRGGRVGRRWPSPAAARRPYALPRLLSSLVIRDASRRLLRGSAMAVADLPGGACPIAEAGAGARAVDASLIARTLAIAHARGVERPAVTIGARGAGRAADMAAGIGQRGPGVLHRCVGRRRVRQRRDGLRAGRDGRRSAGATRAPRQQRAHRDHPMHPAPHRSAGWTKASSAAWAAR